MTPAMSSLVMTMTDTFGTRSSLADGLLFRIIKRRIGYCCKHLLHIGLSEMRVALAS